METVKATGMGKPAAVARLFGPQNRKTTQHSGTREQKKHKRFYKTIL